MTRRRPSPRGANIVAAVAAAGLVTVVMAGCGSETSADDDRTQDDAWTPSAPARPLPGGWRWESFGGVQVGVPGDWGWDNANARISQWCVDGRRAHPAPAVGRPGVSTLVACGDVDEDVPGEMLVRSTGEIVAFEPIIDDSGPPPDQGDRRTVTVGKVAVIVQTRDPRLRQQIADTVHEVDVDAHGCPVDDPSAHRPQKRPPDVGDLADLVEDGGSTDITVSACKYRIDYPDQPAGPPPLLASKLFNGSEAAKLVDAILAARPGGGPNAPGQCMAEHAYGDELTVLHVRVGDPGDAGAASQRVVVTYSGCDHNGIDDGHTVRHLQRDVLGPLSRDALTMTNGISGVLGNII
jgi:hypothetical protein